MKSIIFKAANEPLGFLEKEKPVVLDGEILVKIKASSLNHRDVWMTKGMYPNLQSDTILGSCGAGMADNQAVIINPNVNWGDNLDYPDHRNYTILGMPTNGTFAEYIKVPKDRLVAKPEHLTWEEAAALPLAGMTAYRALFTKTRATSKDKILISGIGGGVALMAFQFAIAIGAEVYVTSSSEEKIEKAIAMGAKAGANYKEEKWSKSFLKKYGGVDVVIDSAAGDGYGDLLKVMNPRGRIVNYGGTRGLAKINPQLLFWKELEIYGSTMGNDQEFKDMVALVNQYKIKPVVDSIFDFSDFAAGFEKMEKGKQFGKIVFRW